MMVLFDPQVFEPVASSLAPTTEELEELERRLSILAMLMVSATTKLVAPEHLKRELFDQFVSPAYSKSVGPKIRSAITFIRNRIEFVRPTISAATARGFLPLMHPMRSGANTWADGLAITAATLALGGRESILFTPLTLGRNAIPHMVGHSQLLEKNRWRVFVGAPGLPGLHPIPCVASIRNIHVPWTSRFDERLPEGPIVGKGFAFVPPADWRLRATVVFLATASKLGWLDQGGNRWVAPNTPGRPYHWDVHFVRTSDSPIGISPVNITMFGVSDGERLPGSVHHVPKAKRGRVR